MKKILIILFIIIIIIGAIFLVNAYSKDSKQKRYTEIKKDINTELERYMYVIAPKCKTDEGTPLITHKDLVYNGGMDKEKFLDTDNKSYCKAYIIPKCNENHIWSWDIKLSCKDYEDEGYVDWDEAFTPKVWSCIFFYKFTLKNMHDIICLIKEFLWKRKK